MPAQINGLVFDDPTNSPINGAQVLVCIPARNLSRTVWTNGAGAFELDRDRLAESQRFAPGDPVIVIVRAKGYDVKWVEAEVGADGGASFQRIALRPRRAADRSAEIPAD